MKGVDFPVVEMRCLFSRNVDDLPCGSHCNRADVTGIAARWRGALRRCRSPWHSPGSRYCSLARSPGWWRCRGLEPLRRRWPPGSRASDSLQRFEGVDHSPSAAPGASTPGSLRVKDIFGSVSPVTARPPRLPALTSCAWRDGAAACRCPGAAACDRYGRPARRRS